jgi:serine/threonine protein kinase
MTTRRNDKRTDAPPKDQDPSARPDLLTSDDLFGDMIDRSAAPLRPPVRPVAAPARTGPIKVQVSEPGAPRKGSPLASITEGERLPEDVAALLDAFSEPAESALREQESAEEPATTEVAPEPSPEPAPEPSLVEELSEEEELTEEPEAIAPESSDALLDRMFGTSATPEPVAPDPPEPEPFEPGRPEPDPLMAVTPADEDEDLLLGIEAPPSANEPDPESVRDLRNLGRSLPATQPVPPDEVEAVKPASRTATKFTAAAPRKAAPVAGPGLDLAALAEDAFASADEPDPISAAPKRSQTSPAGKTEAAGTTAAEASAGTHYGPYRLLERVAVGGMAEVFRAKRSGVEGFEKVVAVKRILSHLSDNKEFVDMFIDEAKMVSSLAHPNVAQIFDLGRHESNYWIAMEYVHGRDLRTILRRAKERGLRIPLDISTYVVSKVCAALEYAHRKKDEKGQPMLIVHRDISPQNILISFEGDVKLTDFGIAKAATKASTTDKGALRGKLLYMSPEQAWGKPMDKRSDVFSLGIVFYEMLTEQKPFLGTSEMSILETVRECRVPAPTTINDRIPEKLERVVMKALERDPEVRYQDAGEMLRDLERVLHEWQPATASGLVRFLELLFDDDERGDAVLPEGGSEARAGSRPAPELREPTAPLPVDPPSAVTAPVKDPMSIQKLLKRFGIK